MPIKSRSFRGSPSGVVVDVRNSVFESWSKYTHNTELTQESSLGINHRYVNGHWDGGGPWKLTRDSFSYLTTHLFNNTVRGEVRLNTVTSSSPNLSYSVPNDTALAAAGTTGIARTAPTNPAFDLATFIGEIRADGFPSLPGSAARDFTARARSSGSEYLNVEFGWKPFINGIRDFAGAVNNSDKIISRYKKESGVWIKRSFRWPVEEETSFRSATFTTAPNQAGFVFGHELIRIKREQWFEADYQYFLPIGSSAIADFQRYGKYARKLLGVELSPATLWNLSPWSWAADWFSNTGDVMASISALGQDGLVIRHGYVMCHVSKDTTWTASNPANNVGGMRRTRLQETKLRLPATPYGFGVSFDSLSARQAAIIAALGISKW